MRDRARSRARPAGAIEEDEILADGFVARLADQVFENPAMSGGLFVMALTAAAIVSNAMMMQNGRHPDPLFMTRPTPAAHAPVPLPRARIEEPKPVPLPRQAPPPAQAAAAPAAVPADPNLVAEIQQALALKKLYRGAADGIAGSRTRAAIGAYEKSVGLPVTGVATADLLARLRPPAKPAVAAKLPAMMPAKPAPAAVAVASAAPAVPPATRLPLQPPAPLPAAAAPVVAAAPARPAVSAAPVERRVVEVPPAPDGSDAPPPVDEAEPSITEDAAPAAALAPAPAAPVAPTVALAPAAAAPAAPAAPAAAPAADPPLPSPGPDQASIERQQYRGIQNALNQAGYGPLPTDGVAGEETASAIRRFELDNGLPLTGKPSDRVTARLVSIGAMPVN